MGKYINPFTDWGFKRLFGQEFSKDLLISFLNDLLEGELHVKDVTFKDKEQLDDQLCQSHHLLCQQGDHQPTREGESKAEDSALRLGASICHQLHELSATRGR